MQLGSLNARIKNAFLRVNAVIRLINVATIQMKLDAVSFI